MRHPRDLPPAIEAAIDVSPQLVGLAKRHVVAQQGGQADYLVRTFLGSLDAAIGDHVTMTPDDDEALVVRRVAGHLSAQIAIREAIWGLLGAGVVVPTDGRMNEGSWGISWTWVTGGGTESTGWNFGHLRIVVPEQVAVAKSTSSATVLTDPDLFLRQLAVPDLHPVVADSLREAVSCFRYGLYTPALAMLARAGEGLWTELGLALAAVPPGTDRAAQQLARDIPTQLHFARLVAFVGDAYERSDLFGEVHRQSDVRIPQIRAVRLWTEEVRDARNVVHFGGETPVPNDYEKVAALLLGAARSVRALADAIRAARSLADVRPAPAVE